MLIEDFNHTIEIWIAQLECYDLYQLCTKPSEDRWSIGQVYIHLIEETNYYLKQIKICVSNNINIDEEATPDGQAMFLNNDFPDKVITGEQSHCMMRQPLSKEQLKTGLLNLKQKINALGSLTSKSRFKGKTQHPGLGYFSGKEWLQFAEMHFRHHLRQKKRIDEFLKTDSDQ